MNKHLLVGVICTLLGTCLIGYVIGRNDQRKEDATNYHYELHAEQLTANDIPVYFVDELPGIGGTKARPDTALAYYDTVKKAVWYSYLHDNLNK